MTLSFGTVCLIKNIPSVGYYWLKSLNTASLNPPIKFLSQTSEKTFNYTQFDFFLKNRMYKLLNGLYCSFIQAIPFPKGIITM